MSTDTHRQIANDIWSICNLLRGPYKRNEPAVANRARQVTDRLRSGCH